MRHLPWFPWVICCQKTATIFIYLKNVFFYSLHFRDYRYDILPRWSGQSLVFDDWIEPMFIALRWHLFNSPSLSISFSFTVGKDDWLKIWKLSAICRISDLKFICPLTSIKHVPILNLNSIPVKFDLVENHRKLLWLRQTVRLWEE